MKINVYGDMNFMYPTKEVAPENRCYASADPTPEVEMEQPEPDDEDSVEEDPEEHTEGFDRLLKILELSTQIYDCVISIENEKKAEEPDDDKIAMFLMPGEKPEVMKWSEVCELLPDFDEKTDRMNGFTDANLVLYYRPDQVITFGDKEYLLGAAAVVCEDDDYNLVSMDGKEIYEVFQYAEDCTTTLCCNDRDFPALALGE